MFLKLTLVFLLTVGLIAEDAPPQTTIADLQERIAYLQRKLQMYQQGLFACQDAQIDAQAKAKEKAK